jgi:hypothetical protein
MRMCGLLGIWLGIGVNTCLYGSFEWRLLLWVKIVSWTFWVLCCYSLAIQPLVKTFNFGDCVVGCSGNEPVGQDENILSLKMCVDVLMMPSVDHGSSWEDSEGSDPHKIHRL